MTKLTDKLFAGRWQPLHARHGALVAMPIESELRFPGVYLLGCSNSGVSRPARAARRRFLCRHVELGRRHEAAIATVSIRYRSARSSRTG
jgi:hypothetical protein